MKLKLFLISLGLVLLYSCGGIKSLAVINQSYSEVKGIFKDDLTIGPNATIKFVEKKDSLVVISSVNNNPFEAVYLFENDSCYFQQLKIYCSPCADKMVSDIVADKNYHFEVIDPVNYISKKDNSIVMRLKEKLDYTGNCNEIIIHKISR